MKVLITRFLTLFAVIAGFTASIPDSAHAVHFGPIPGIEDEHEGDDAPDDETPDEGVK